MAALHGIPRPYRTAIDRVPDGAIAGQVVADLSDVEEVVVFVIGMRIHRWRKVRSWWPAFTAMPRMLAELNAHPEQGFLGVVSGISGRTLVSVQYWRSAEDLGRYAKDRDLSHAPAWSEFNKVAAGSGDLGLFHETYVVKASAIESRYANMPPYGLGAALGVLGRGDVKRRTEADDELGVREPEYVDA